ncbi:glycosyltransferase family 4 protein [Cyanobacterium aponinum]|uniref:glycosyltransferase family 4 protein n=1 Tax=Cyanobacterium aponinum TaxID=379064 RepID=UPI000C12BBDA|nr:glycosyltransferase family 4 protein [Cyanobacterium aponinum]PHV61396.1 glycosyl transferase family 1 [Cyanobacterium aponinum IPPAS B-1201]
MINKKVKSLKIAIALPGLHRVIRGAEVALESIAFELAKMEGLEITLFGSGYPKENHSYHFIHIDNTPREKFESWLKFPIFRSEYAYEEFTFFLNLQNKYQPKDFDLTVACSYPFINWLFTNKGGKNKPPHVFITQNGDYPACHNRKEYRFFQCDGLVCTNPEYYARNKDQWFSTLIPNGVNPDIFTPASTDRSQFNLPDDVPIVLMVSALIPSKRVTEGIKAVSQLENVHLVVCGDGSERDKVLSLGKEKMCDRFHLLQLSHSQMPDIYRMADVFLHLSLDEPFGIVYLEALSNGLPIITHKNLTSEWILENTSFLINTENEEEIVSTIKKVLASSNNIDLINQRINLVKERFSWSKISKEYLQFFKEVIVRNRK